jgi:hypothetical protein
MGDCARGDLPVRYKESLLNISWCPSWEIAVSRNSSWCPLCLKTCSHRMPMHFRPGPPLPLRITHSPSRVNTAIPTILVIPPAGVHVWGTGCARSVALAVERPVIEPAKIEPCSAGSSRSGRCPAPWSATSRSPPAPVAVVEAHQHQRGVPQPQMIPKSTYAFLFPSGISLAAGSLPAAIPRRSRRTC